MSVLDRLEKIRINENLKKKDFEKIIGKSSGYIKILKDKNGIPGSDVLIKVSEHFRNYDINWLLTGEGYMLKGEGSTVAEPETDYGPIAEMREDIKKMTANFEILSRGMQMSLQKQVKILDFIEKLDADDIKGATARLNRFLEEEGK